MLLSKTGSEPGSDPDFSGNEDFELLQVALGDAPLEVEHLDADNLLLGVEVQHDARLHLLGLDNLRVVQAKVKRIDLRVVADSHVLPRCRRSKQMVTTRGG